MKARMPAGFGRPDMNALMRQAQKMQDDMKAKQAEMEAAEYTGSASGEMVTVRMNGKHEILGITIKPEAVDPDDIGWETIYTIHWIHDIGDWCLMISLWV